MSSNDINDFRKPLGYTRIKRISLIFFLVFVSIIMVACNKPGNEGIDGNSEIEVTTNQPTGSPITEPIQEPTPTQETEPTEEPTPTQGPEPTEEPTPTQETEPTEELTPTQGPEPTIELTPTQELEPTVIPTSTKKPTTTDEANSMSDFIPSEEVLHSTTAFVQGDYLFYKTGKLTKTVIASENRKTSKVTEITSIEDTFFNSSEFYLQGSDIYYHAEGDIYRVGVDGKNKTRLFKGTATILGFHKDKLYALDRKAREIIQVGKTGEKKVLVKLNSIDTLEVVMVPNGFYYIDKSTNNTLRGNDPIDRLYYINFDGNDKTEIYAERDIYDLKLREDEVFFLVLSDVPEVMKLIKVNNRKATTIHSSSKEELEAQGCNWLDKNNFTLLAVNTTHVYYGIDFNNGKEMNLYSVETDGENHGLYQNAYDIKGMNPSAYFRSGGIEEDYLKIVFDCDEDPVEVYLIDLKDKSTIKFEGGYYLSGTIDVVGDYVYYLKSSEYDHYGEKPEAYQYGRSKILDLK